MKTYPVEFLNWPIVTAENCFRIIGEKGIRMFPRTAPNMTVPEFLKIASPDDAKNCLMFAPKPFVASHFDPHKNVPYIVYAAAFKYYACVFGLITYPWYSNAFGTNDCRMEGWQ